MLVKLFEGHFEIKKKDRYHGSKGTKGILPILFGLVNNASLSNRPTMYTTYTIATILHIPSFQLFGTFLRLIKFRWPKTVFR